MSKQYTGLFADFYDLIQNTCYELPAYIEFMKTYGNTILELGSGTGRLTIPLAHAGARITGLDINDDMIALCQRKINDAIKNNIKIIHGDMTNFHLSDSFDLVVAPCNAINHLLSLDELTKMLLCVRDHLRPNGRLIIDNSLPRVDELLKSNGELEINDFVNKEKNTVIRDYYVANYDFVNGLEYDHIKLEEYANNSLMRVEEIDETTAFYYPRELRYVLMSNDYTIEREIGSLKNGTKLTKESKEMVFICSKN
ncbi:hypothetical protein SPIRO4BDMA_10010 [uncultured spirochete]|jgi:SAM-dependent methyltransferase|uniref:Methyltransferase domain-containing protein n=1 Tax=uncultured spirochete TaxID=156406 RepID=A0A3P3XM50_9SPIR|nr:hypothetical protein SPIRO4BDMA_10010 [uncultured spirochete]